MSKDILVRSNVVLRDKASEKFCSLACLTARVYWRSGAIRVLLYSSTSILSSSTDKPMSRLERMWGHAGFNKSLSPGGSKIRLSHWRVASRLFLWLCSPLAKKWIALSAPGWSGYLASQSRQSFTHSSGFLAKFWFLIDLSLGTWSKYEAPRKFPYSIQPWVNLDSGYFSVRAYKR